MLDVAAAPGLLSLTRVPAGPAPEVPFEAALELVAVVLLFEPIDELPVDDVTVPGPAAAGPGSAAVPRLELDERDLGSGEDFPAISSAILVALAVFMALLSVLEVPGVLAELLEVLAVPGLRFGSSRSLSLMVSP